MIEGREDGTSRRAQRFFLEREGPMNRRNIASLVAAAAMVLIGGPMAGTALAQGTGVPSGGNNSAPALSSPPAGNPVLQQPSASQPSPVMPPAPQPPARQMPPSPTAPSDSVTNMPTPNCSPPNCGTPKIMEP